MSIHVPTLISLLTEIDGVTEAKAYPTDYTISQPDGLTLTGEYEERAVTDVLDAHETYSSQAYLSTGDGEYLLYHAIEEIEHQNGSTLHVLGQTDEQTEAVVVEPGVETADSIGDVLLFDTKHTNEIASVSNH